VEDLKEELKFTGSVFWEEAKHQVKYRTNEAYRRECDEYQARHATPPTATAPTMAAPVVSRLSRKWTFRPLDLMAGRLSLND
jgi:hypothetical protein